MGAVVTRQCTHVRKGIVSNQDLSAGFDRNRPLYSRAVCDREQCIAAAIVWAAGNANEPARYYADPIRPALIEAAS